MKTKQASLESHETKMMNFREKIEKSEPQKFQKNQQDVDFRAKAAGRYSPRSKFPASKSDFSERKSARPLDFRSLSAV
ncbi:MAG: hypothetical protein Q4A78_07980 [Peptostreptococcaceae bacterium]|nr:hypothetical protein [Peptostreptococcaceae bacterium]